MRVAGVDCGTNSIRLLIADVVNGRLVEVRREMRIVRLGQGVDATGQFAPEAIARTRAALHEFCGFMVESGVERVRMTATSAARDASNREDFFAMTAAELGVVSPGAVAEVISGAEEAALSFAGAIGELSAVSGPFVVVDLGGGSTEVIMGDESGVRESFSADIGCVRLTERCLHSDPPTADEIADARSFVHTRLSEAFARVDVTNAHTWVGVAGTFTTLAALTLGMQVYDRERVHMSRVNLPELYSLTERLVRMNHDERKDFGVIHPGRVDVIGGGAIVASVLAEELAKRAGITELVVSEHDILDGITLSIA